MTTRLDITPEEYHERDEISSSNLRLYRSNGAPDYYASCIAKVKPFPQTDAMRLGSCTHIAVETPGSWKERIQIVPDTVEPHPCVAALNSAMPDNSKAKQLIVGDAINNKLPLHRQYMARMKYEAESVGKIWCTVEEAEMFAGQVEAILADPKCREIIEAGGNREQAAINVHEGTGLEIRALGDIDNPGVYGTDLKTTKERTALGFAYDAKKRKYHLQLAHYESVFDWEGSGLIAVTNEFPYYALHYEFDDEMKREAVEANDWVMAELAARYATDPHDANSWRPEGYGMTTTICRDGIDKVQWDE